MARGRKPLLINARELQDTINQLEEVRVFANRTELWDAVEQTMWAQKQSPRPLKGQVAMLKAKQYNLEVKTPVGKRGREKGCAPIAGGGRKKRKIDTQSIIALKHSIPKEVKAKLEKAVNRTAKGSMKAAVKLKCLDCTNWQPVEVRMCEVNSCPLWNFRPYKRAKTVVAELTVI